MGIGPFSTYAPPGVYTSTTIQAAEVNQLLGGIRIPVLIGTGQETLVQTNYELIRGSSSVADTPIFAEDVSGRWMAGGTNNNPVLVSQNGSYLKFRVRNYPIVDGTGIGRITYDASKISVTVNGVQVVATQVDGANGIVTLLLPTNPTDSVAISYYFHRKDTNITDDVSTQVTSAAAALTAPKAEPYNIIATNNILKIVLNDTNTYSVALVANPSKTAIETVNDIILAGIPGLSASVHVDAQGQNHVQLNALGNIQITTDSTNASSIFGFNPGDYTGRNKNFHTYNGPIVDGSDGGITTNDTSKVVVIVNGVQVIAASLDGANRLVTLPFAPNPNSTVTIRYYFNTFQDTFDYLPNNNITAVGNVGIAPNRSDYLNGTDFVIININDQSIIQWGTAFTVTSDTTTGNVPFGSTQITGMLVDNRIYGVQCQRYTDPSTNAVSTTTFVLPIAPTTGNGRDTPLGQSLYQTITNGRIDLPTNRPDLVIVHTGKTFRDASLRPAVAVLEVESSNGTFVLKNPVPADYNVYATFWYNIITDESYLFNCVASGPSGVGSYTVTTVSNNAPIYQVKFGSKSGSLVQQVQWPSGAETNPDAIFYGGTPVNETVTVTFRQALDPATHASFSNANAGPYDIYTQSANFGVVNVDGGNHVTVDLTQSFAAQMVGAPVDTSAPLSFATTDYLALRVDGATPVSVSLSGCTSAASVVAAINLATAGTNASAIAYGSTASTLFKVVGNHANTIYGGTASSVAVVTPTGTGQVDASAKLGLQIGSMVYGAYEAINQPAFMVGTNTQPFSFTAGINDQFAFGIDGVNYSATIAAGTTAAADVVTILNAAAGATVAIGGTGLNSGEVVLFSSNPAVNSAVNIGLGTANTVLGFVNNAAALRTQPTAATIAGALNANASFASCAVAYPIAVAGLGTFLEINSLSTGSTSTLSFSNPTNNSALIPDTYLGIVPGTSGAIGENAQSGFAVTSSAGAAGSHGTGIPGQTYTDAVTGLRFTILPLAVGDYADTGYFTLNVGSTMVCDAGIPVKTIPGVEFITFNTTNVGTNSTATLTTYEHSSSQPQVGDVYYASYNYEKTDTSTALYSDYKKIQANFGPPTPQYPLSLGARIAILNGAVLVGLKQVLVAPGSSQASVASYTAAIDEQRTPITGNIKPDVIVPLANDPQIFAYLGTHCVYMSSPRQEGERTGIVGCAAGTIPNGVQSIAKGIYNSLMSVVYPDVYTLTVIDNSGNATTQTVDGSFCAAAMAGSTCNPAVDVATPWTRRAILGFDSIGRVLDPTEANQVAVSGVTVMETYNSGIRVRHGLTTQMDTVITRTPSVQLIIQYVQQSTRTVLDPFIGQKFTNSLLKSAETQLGSMFSGMIPNIIQQVAGVSATVDESDPTIMDTSAIYVPIFPLEYIMSTLQVRISM